MLKFYLRRYYRITIPLILCMLFTVGLNKYFHMGKFNFHQTKAYKLSQNLNHQGPFYSRFCQSNENGCPKSFWTNLLYINNIKNEVCVV